MKKKKEKKHQADEALWVVTSVPEFSIFVKRLSAPTCIRRSKIELFVEQRTDVIHITSIVNLMSRVRIIFPIVAQNDVKFAFVEMIGTEEKWLRSYLMIFRIVIVF